MTTARRRVGPTAVKLMVAAVGLVAFGWGVRTESIRWRWWGIALVGVAAALRVWRERPTDAGNTVAGDEDR